MLTVFTWGGFLSPRVRMPGLFVIVAVQPLVLVFGVYFASLFEYPPVSIGVVGWLVWGAEQTRRTLLEWLFPLTGFRAFESGIDYRILSTFSVNAALMLVAM